MCFAHDLVRDGVLDKIGALRLAELHGVVADAMAERAPEDLAPIARHRVAAALGAVDGRAARRASRRRVRLWPAVPTPTQRTSPPRDCA